MGVLSDLEPKRVFAYFEEITKIPHGSGNVEKLSDYLARFGERHGLTAIQDQWKNVILIKEAAPGYEREPPVILQGHMDMVAVKKKDCEIDMKKEGLRVAVRGDQIYAEGTSLGGDDGIAIAYALALLEAKDLKHPRLEVVLTVDEETGMDGARAIDLSMLKGRRMINLDSEEEGVFLVSCAGGARVSLKLSLKRQQSRGRIGRLAVGGLLGGHSGGEIHKERGNSNLLMGRLLSRLSQKIPFRLAELSGGLADNAIPRETRARLVCAGEDWETLRQTVRTLEREVRAELSAKDPGVFFRAEEEGEGSLMSLTLEDTRRAAAFLRTLPNGVQAMSADMPGLVETSLNLGVLTLAPETGELAADFSVRSSVESAKRALIERLEAIAWLAGGEAVTSGDYPGWKYRKESPLREKMTAVYERLYGVSPRIEAIHAGLECGILGSKIADLDCVSIGPEMRDIHTTEETLCISSVRRVWEYLTRLLEEKDC